MADLSIVNKPAEGDGPAVALLKGHIDNKTCAKLDTWIGAFLAQHGDGAKLDLDFSQVEFLTSRGVSVLVAYVDRMEGAGGQLRVINLRGEVRTVLDRLGFTGMGFIV